MEKVKVSEAVRYAWECPKCHHFNEDTEDPEYEETIFCEECGSEFIPEKY